MSELFAEVFVANRHQFLAFIERRVGSRALAEDLLQEAFVRGLGRTRARDEGSVIAWFYRALRNAAIDLQRRNEVAGRSLVALAATADQEASGDPDLRDAVCKCVGRLAGTLKPEYAAALARIELDGVSVKDYAHEVGISASNAAARVFRARAALRTRVSQSCGACAAQGGCRDCTCREATSSTP